jgi:outer membrane receptor protein involved in Fe transport
MNGRRIVPSTSVGSVDVNILPSQLIASVETITGGASATYGSDAMAGVINFPLRDDFEGLDIKAQAGVTDRDDGNTEAVSIAIGGDFGGGNGHAMLMLSYNRRDDISNGTRDFSKISGPSAASPLGSTIFDTGNLPTPGAISTARPGAVNTNTFGFNDNGSLFSYINRNGFMSPGGIDWDGFGQPGQFLLTLGVSWFLAALGVFFRDLGQINGFLLTVWFFLTPICYPQTSLPEKYLWLFEKNPMYVLVESYRAIFLEGAAPPWESLAVVTAVSAIIFILGHAWFYKLKGSFADLV